MPFIVGASFTLRVALSQSSENLIFSSTCKLFLHDIFGDHLNAEDGLVDADNDEFEGMIYSPENIWNEGEMICNNPPQF